MYGGMQRTNRRSVPLREHREHVEGRAAGGLLAAEVVRQLVVQRRSEVRSFGDEAVVDEHRVGDRRQAAGAPVLQAHQADEIGPVAVERQGQAADLVAAQRRVADRLVLVGDVAEHVALGVLRPRQPEVRADAPVDGLHLGLAVGVAIDAAQPHEAAAVDQLGLDPPETVLQVRQRELVAAERQQVVGDRERVAQGGVQLGLLGGVEVLGPRVLVGDVGRRPLALRFEDPWARRRGHGDSSRAS